MAQYAIIFAVLLAILGVIPFVGFILTLVPAVTIAFAQSGGFAAEGSWKIPLIVALIFIVVQQFDGIVVQPRIVGESVGLHPLTVIFSVFFWSLLIGGILGALLAVPLTASVKVLVPPLYLGEQAQVRSGCRVVPLPDLADLPRPTAERAVIRLLSETKSPRDPASPL